MKEIWHVSKTGGCSYTFGHTANKISCTRCNGLGRIYNGGFFNSSGGMTTTRGLPQTGMRCVICEGKGFHWDYVGRGIV